MVRCPRAAIVEFLYPDWHGMGATTPPPPPNHGPRQTLLIVRFLRVFSIFRFILCFFPFDLCFDVLGQHLSNSFIQTGTVWAPQPPRMFPDSSATGPRQVRDGVRDGSATGPRQVRDRSATGPRRVRDGSATGPRRVRDRSATGPRQVRDGSATGPRQVRDRSATGPRQVRDDWSPTGV